MKRILLGGSPCTFWSIIQNPKKRETQAEGQGWELFLNYVIAKEKFKPDFFLYENNESINKKIQDQIADNLGVDTLMHFNSAAVSAQSRRRIYGSNVATPPPEDRNIMLADIVDDDVEPIALTRPRFREKNCRIYFNGKSPTITAAGGGDHIPRVLYKGHSIAEIRADNYRDISRPLNVHEVARLQTMPSNYADMLSKTQALNALGNGWTAEIIKHIMQKWNISKDEDLLILSLYDGIATGRYCLDSLGYKKVKYIAYEIAKQPIKCAVQNYPDIIEMGDAFAVRDKDWNIEKIMEK